MAQRVKQILLRVLAYFPRYFMELVSLVFGPKKFISTKKISETKGLLDSLAFLSFSFSILFVLSLVFFPTKESIWIRLGRGAARDVLTIPLLAGGIWCVWRAVGAKIRFRSSVALCSYFFSVLYLFTFPFVAVADSLFKSYDPNLYSKMVEGGGHSAPVLDAPSDTVPDLPGLIILAGFVIVLLWGCLLWGSFRPLANVSKARSFAAFAIFGILFSVLVVLRWWFSK
jgi:hypothetical protein